MSIEDKEVEKLEIPKEFTKIITDFINDLVGTFPDKINKKLFFVENDASNINPTIYNFCKEVYPKRFFDILYENVDIFNDKDIIVELLPGINFTELWHEDISDKTKSTIWKYLQLILFSIVTDINSGESFGDTAKLFEAINQDEFKKKIEETIQQMENIFNSNSEESNNTFTSNDSNNHDDDESMKMPQTNLPNAEELHNHINSMMEGKLGCLAKEIAEETAKDLDIDMENANSVNDVFKQLFKNPTKLMDLVKNVGSKLDNKIKSGEIKESELLEEASELVNKMKDMPGMNNLESMFSQMGAPGMGKGGKVNMNAFNQHMQQNLKAAKMRDRMRTKLQEKEKNDSTLNNEFLNKNSEENLEDIMKRKELIKSLGINLEGMEEFTFSTGETVDKSSRPSTNRKKKKHHKKKIN